MWLNQWHQDGVIVEGARRERRSAEHAAARHDDALSKNHGLLGPSADQRSRHIILLDNAGVGRSEGVVLESIGGWAEWVRVVLAVIDVPTIDLLGFSMGSYAAQHVVHQQRGWSAS